ncbi:PDR/VanB family oxidoreductase [Tritonibacter scottomollicae]|uniref:PDR/VanB family oxidoreductase n=1 Tax=Tritonibacter scottomollicae TaxID=483013 RepID=UPI003AA84329
MTKSIHRVTTQIQEITSLTPTVKRFRLTDPDHWDLPPFTPGAHIDLHLPDGTIRQYSLCGDPADKTAYQIAVQLEPNGRGGSKAMHELELEQELLVSLPRNLLPLVEAPQVVLIAGGIGITPFIPMIHQLQRAGRAFALHFASRSENATPLAGELTNLCPDQVSFYHGDTGTRLNIEQIIAGLGEADHLYCCGPARMIDEVLDRTPDMADRVHVEAFGPNAVPQQTAYQIHLARSNRTLPVAEGQTMLEALRSAEIAVPASCEGGICLDCKTAYLEGTPVHRDITMPKSDRKRFLTPCVSGCSGHSITLDL